MNQMSTLNNPLEVDIPLNNQTTKIFPSEMAWKNYFTLLKMCNDCFCFKTIFDLYSFRATGLENIPRVVHLASFFPSFFLSFQVHTNHELF